MSLEPKTVYIQNPDALRRFTNLNRFARNKGHQIKGSTIERPDQVSKSPEHYQHYQLSNIFTFYHFIFLTSSVYLSLTKFNYLHLCLPQSTYVYLKQPSLR